MADLIRSPLSVPVGRVLICDDRATACGRLAQLLTPASCVGSVGAVADGAALVTAFAARPAGLVLICLRRGGRIGPAAVDLLLTRAPSAAVVVYGTSADV